MLKFLSILLLTLSAAGSTAAQNSACSAWTKQNGMSCILAGEFADIYQRQCENPCWENNNGNGNMGQNCNKEKICHFDDPESFQGPCSEWIPVRGMSCYDPNSQSWEQSWVRSCTVGLRESWCSREIPLE